jgi:hypothetical protein
MTRVDKLIPIQEALSLVRGLPVNDPVRLKVYAHLSVGKKFIWMEQP